MRQFEDVYRHKQVLLTGHTGFKGSWLALWLQQLGAEVTGVSLDPESSPNHWDLLDLELDDRRRDIRDLASLAAVFAERKPDVVFHLAAQPLVRRSYREPVETWSTNVMGTANVLEACRRTDSVRAIVVVTTDKCYDNREWPWGYRENDALGGRDPYSASKAAAELVVASYRKAFFETGKGGPLIATARAGNVIGGGDWSEDRLVPDLVRAVKAGRPLEVRSPSATRPWQHVLESLSGYLLLGQKLLQGEQGFAEAWNFGPDAEGNRSVAEVLDRLAQHLPDVRWQVSRGERPHEATLLYLDCAKVRRALDWRPVWGLEAGVAATATWYRAWLQDGEVTSANQLSEYVAAAARAKLVWASA